MSRLIILIGAPGSGKSYYCNLLKKKGYNIHSSDALRNELFGSENDQQKPWLVFKILYERIIKDLKSNTNVVLDACNTNKGSRKKVFKTLKDNNLDDVEIIGILMNTSKKDCIQRDIMRDRTVGEEVIERMFLDLNKCPPSLEEGFTKLLTIEEFENEI